MNKKIKILVFLMMLFVSISVKAETVTQQFVEGVWSYHYRNGDVWTFGNLPYNYLDGKLVYCIQPDARIATSNYYTYGDFSLSGYSEDVKREMELISYYGYGYEGHNTLKYYMATQELLWLYSKDEYIKWTTSNNRDSSEIDISNEKEEIRRLIRSHNVLPSFSNMNFETNEGDEFLLIDYNSTLEKYDIDINDNVMYEKDGNKLKLKFLEKGEYIINFNPKVNYNSNTLIYDDFSIRTQTLASFGKPNLDSFSIKVIVNPKSKIIINKTDEENNNLEGVSFEIYDKDYNIVDNITTIKDKTSSKELSNGTYYVKETKELYGYVKDENLYEININNKDEEINIINEKIKCEVTVISMGNDKKIDASFNIFDSNGYLIYTGFTTNGVLSLNLPYGDYVLKEISVPNGYLLNNKEINFSVNNKTCISTLSVLNEEIKMPVTTTSNYKISYMLLFLFNIGGFIFVKKNS